MILTKDKGQRMWGGFGDEGDYGVSGGSGGGGYMPDLSNYVTLDFIKSITWWGRALPEEGTDIVGALTGVTDITMTGAITGTTNLTMTGTISGATGLTMNNGAITGATTITASGLATVGSLRIGDAILEWDNGNNALKIRKSTGANDAVNVYATGGVSALGYASGGGGGGATALTDLVDVAISSPSSGQGLVYDATASKWKNATLFTAMSYENNVLSVTVSGVTKTVTIQAGSSGSVTSVAAGTGLTTDQSGGAAITSSGTISIDSTTQTNIGKGVTAFGWGDHAQAGYLTSSSLTGYATQQWVQQQGYLTSSSISDMATKTWVGQQGFLTSSAISDMATKTWVGQQGFLTSSAISDMATKTWVGQQGYLTSSSISDMATKTWVGQQGFLTASSASTTYVSIAFFSRLFQAKNGSTNVNPNNTTSTIDSIKAMFGFWTDQYLSALGQSSGGSGGSTALTDLVDVATSNVSNGQGLVYDSSTTKWKNATLFTAMSYKNSVLSLTVSGVTKKVTINSGGGGATTLADLTDTNISSPSSGQALIYNGSKWANSAINLTLGGLSNVVLSSPTNGQVLKYNGTNWVNGSGGGGGSSTLAGLTDVSVSGASGGDVLAYNSSTQKWEAASDYVNESGNTSLKNTFEPYSNGGANLGSNYFRFGYVYGQHGNFNTDLIIGSIKLTYDSTNNALKVQKSDGTAANLYALGSVSALGFSGGPSSTSITNLTVTNTLTINGGGTIASDGELYIGNSANDATIYVNDICSMINHNLWSIGAETGYANFARVTSPRYYLDSTRYLYLSSTHLYFYNGSSNIQIA